MSNEENTTTRRKNKHLTYEERVIIQTRYEKDRMRIKDIADEIGCSKNTIRNEIRRGSLPMYKDKRPHYRASQGQTVYRDNRASSKRNYRLLECRTFIKRIVADFYDETKKWSVDAAVGRAKRDGAFEKGRTVCTKTIYNYISLGLIKISATDLPEKLGRNTKRGQDRARRKVLGSSIEERPAEVGGRGTFGHWECDSVVGRRDGAEPVIMTIVERMTDFFIPIKITGKNADAYMDEGIAALEKRYGKEKFSKIFKTITADNGSENARLKELDDRYGTKVYFAHPYTSCERPVNERHNRMLRRFVPKGKSIAGYTMEDIEEIEDWINGLPRRRLSYATPEELFNEQLDLVYRAA